jgi:serpin B
VTYTSSTDVGGTPERLVSAEDRTQPGDPKLAGRAMAGFGTDLLRRVHGTEPNTLISPYSIYAVLAMARAGAEGDTATQLDAALGISGADEQGAAIAAIDTGIAKALAAAELGRNPITLTASNEVWVADGLAVRQDYLDRLAREFGVSAVAADFAGQPEQMRQAINSWVSERTNNLIPQLIPEGSIDAETLMVLVNALYLKAPWYMPFGSPRLGTFTAATGSEVRVPMMTTRVSGTEAPAGGWAAATVPYAGHYLQMTLLVPELGNFDALLTGLDADLLVTASGGTRDCELTMPQFNVTSTPDVQQAIINSGVLDLFGPSADLSGIAGDPGDLLATALIHQAVIKVDQYGTEAAAATAMMMAGSGAPVEPPLIVRADRPFFFWISETTTGAPLFLGAVTDPS